MVRDSRRDEVSRVGYYHTGLSEAGSWVGLLHGGGDGDARDDDGQGEVRRDERLVDSTAVSGKEDVLEDDEDDRDDVESEGRRDEGPLPPGRIRLLPLLEARLGPRVGKVDEEDETEENEEGRAGKGDVGGVEDEEGVGNGEGSEDEDDPNSNFRTPPSTESVSRFIQSNR